MSKLDLLKPRVKSLAEKLLVECKKQNISLVITQTQRTKEEQDKLYESGRTKPGKIVTQVRGGYSFHNYGVAFDFCPLKNGKADWNDIKQFNKIGALGMSLGLEWGGSWKKFKDRPHFQFTGGYTIDNFLDNKVDWKKFE